MLKIKMAESDRQGDHPSAEQIEEMLPPTAKRRVYERIALKIREFAGTPLDQPLNPWKLAPFVKLRVMSLNQIEGLSRKAVDCCWATTAKAGRAGQAARCPTGRGWSSSIPTTRASGRRPP